ncbi:preprotein translocase subunit SecG [Aliiroseovarius subalbicans]|uniref:preprotein translocase subunit SecG n=1 Tax=Aliiroseovarius subalbicans TaxID=2925840 RepID=UPI001F595989|nr:preprotein translocase subunit SecG [Aliiroseovarius subalbicans]MCI2397906.1 preprotein translocase subunit SecG [Aliiroseovarius subalbicans]
MENVLLVIHLILALALIGVVLLQRSEGGGLGIGGGGGGGGGVMSSRGAATALGKVTWIFAIAFLVTSISLTILAARNSSDTSVVDALGSGVPATEETAPVTPDVTDLLPPVLGDDSLTPPRAD